MITTRCWVMPGVCEFGFRAPARFINSNHRPHWATRSKAVRQWRSATLIHARAQRVPSFTAGHITVTVHYPDQRRRDVHNLAPTAKAIIDGLVDAGVFPDDNDAHLTGPDLRRGATVTELACGAGIAPYGAVTITIQETSRP
ncbi:MAG: hypothetical protein ACRCZP_11485 [Phycicoccus sp.]